MDSLAQENLLGFVPAGDVEAEAPRRIVKITLPKLRSTDSLEPEVEVDLEADISQLVQTWLNLLRDEEFETLRAQRAAAVAAKAKERVEKMSDFVQERIREFVEKHRKAGTKYYDLVLENQPDVKVRLGLRAQQPAIIVEEEPLVIEHFTKDALPTDTELGPCELIPEYWKLHKNKLNEIVKAGAEIPGVKVVERGDAAYIKEL